MKFKFLGTSLAVLLLGISAWAQTFDSAYERKIRSAAISLIGEYEISADLHDRYAVQEFKSLFVNPSAMVFSDLLEYSPLQQVPLNEYIEALSSKENVSLILSSLKFEKPVMDNGLPSVKVHLKKSLTYSREEVLFATQSYYNAPYDIVLSLVYDESEDCCFIKGIQGSVDSPREVFKDHFFVIQHSPKDDKIASKYDDVVKNNGLPLGYNDFNQAFAASDSFELDDYDTDIIPVIISRTESYDYIRLSYKTHPLRIKPVLSFAAGSAYSFDAPDDIKAQSMAIEEGIDFGYSFHINGIGLVGIYTGLRMNVSRINFSSAGPFSFSQNAKYSYSGPKGQTIENYYTRYYTISSATEGAQYVDFVLPLYAGVEFYLDPKIRLEVDFGIKKYFNLNMPNSGVKPYAIEGNVVGIGIGESELTESEEYKLGPLNVNSSSVLYPGDYCQRNPISLTLAANADYLILPEYRISLTFGLGFEQGIAATHKGSGLPLMLGETFIPVIYNQNKNCDLITRTFIESASFTRQAVWINLGLKIKI